MLRLKKDENVRIMCEKHSRVCLLPITNTVGHVYFLSQIQ